MNEYAEQTTIRDGSKGTTLGFEWQKYGLTVEKQNVICGYDIIDEEK